MKDQHTDQFTVNLEREIAKNFSVSAHVHLQAHGRHLRQRPDQPGDGPGVGVRADPVHDVRRASSVQLYSVVLKDYNGDGVVDSDDIAWIGDNTTSQVQNLPAFDGMKPKRDYHGLQLVFRRSGTPTAGRRLASFLYSTSDGHRRAARSGRTSTSRARCSATTTGWAASTHTINNLEGPLPFTPK